jgi:predicted DsbA family dithiol-disulfide isomerase
VKVEIYSDIVCPWCYLGERRFRRALRDYPHAADVAVFFRAYQLDPNAPASPVPLTDYLVKRFGATLAGKLRQVMTAAEAEGIHVDWKRAVAANTRHAQRLLQLAEREYDTDVQRDLAERLFAAHFVEGGNVNDVALLAALAADAGMSAERARAYLASDEGEQELSASLAAAAELGIRAVPTFVFNGRYVVEGAQSPRVFLEVLTAVEQAAADQPT